MSVLYWDFGPVSVGSYDLATDRKMNPVVFGGMMNRSDLRQWAISGARQRLTEIANEQRSILAAFPELRGSASGSSGAQPAQAMSTLTRDKLGHARAQTAIAWSSSRTRTVPRWAAKRHAEPLREVAESRVAP